HSLPVLLTTRKKPEYRHAVPAHPYAPRPLIQKCNYAQITNRKLMPHHVPQSLQFLPGACEPDVANCRHDGWQYCPVVQTEQWTTFQSGVTMFSPAARVSARTMSD